MTDFEVEETKRIVSLIEAAAPYSQNMEDTRDILQEQERLLKKLRDHYNGRTYFYGEIVNDSGKAIDTSQFPCEVVQGIIESGETYNFPLPELPKEQMVKFLSRYKKEHGFVPEIRKGPYGENYVVVKLVINQ